MCVDHSFLVTLVAVCPRFYLYFDKGSHKSCSGEGRTFMDLSQLENIKLSTNTSEIKFTVFFPVE